MFKKLRINVGRVAILLSLMFFSQSAYAQETSAPNLNQDEVKELTEFITKAKTGKSPLSWKKEPSMGSSTKFWYQSVIVAKGEKITLAYWPSDEKNPQFSLWWRKNGTSGKGSLDGAGVNSDGSVGSGSGPNGEYCRFRTKPQTLPISGEEHQAYCQNELNKRLRAALEYYRKK